MTDPSRAIQSMWASLVLAIAAFLPGACVQTSLTRETVRTVYTTSSNAAPGIPEGHTGFRKTVAGLDGADGRLRVVVVNGMATDRHGYSFDLQEKIAEGLGLADCRADRTIALDPPGFDFTSLDGDATEFPAATLRITEWAARNGTERLVFYELLWTPYADAYTDRYLARFETSTVFRRNADPIECGKPEPAKTRRRRPDGDDWPEQAWFNGWIKDHVIMGGMTDAVLSVGPLGMAARDAIRQSICIMAADALELPPRPSESPRCRLMPDTVAAVGGSEGVAAHLEGHDFAFITYSLGSFLLLDALDEYRLWPVDLGPPELACALASPLLDGTPVYMFSNQISLLIAAHPHFGCEPGRGCELFGEFGDERLRLADPRDRISERAPVAPCAQDTRLHVIAFNDPDDVIGHTVPHYVANSPLVGALTNVRVRNPALRVPGLFTSPTAAHTGYDDNPAVLELLLEGWPADTPDTHTHD